MPGVASRQVQQDGNDLTETGGVFKYDLTLEQGL